MAKSADENKASAANLAANMLNDLQGKINANVPISTEENALKLADIEDTVEVVDTAISAEDIEAFLAWKQKHEAEKALAAAVLIVEKLPVGPVLMQMYDVIGNGITGASNNPAEQNLSILKGRVSSADLVTAEVDIAWLLETGAIVEAGLTYG